MYSEEQEDVYSGYFNRDQFKIKVLGGCKFRLPKNYQLCQLIGNGGYGTVCAAFDQTTKKFVAIKKINQMDCNRQFLKRILREIKILRNIENVNAIKLLDIVLPESRSAFQDIYLVFEKYDRNLSSVIKLPEVTIEYVQFYTAHIIFGMLCLHSQGILHRDLKPQNILINKNNDLKICDFGLSRVIPKDDIDTGLTDYVFTRYYRAPQLLLRNSKYTEAVDIWSVGCVIAEMLIKQPLFSEDKTVLQMKKIIDFCGLELDDVISYEPAEQEFFLQNFDLGPGNNQFLYDISPQGADLVMKILKIDPTQRMPLEEALKHPFIEKYTKQMVLPPETSINPLEFQFEKRNLSATQLKDLIYEEILLYHFPEFSKAYMEKLQKKESVISHVVDFGEKMEMEVDSMDHF